LAVMQAQHIPVTDLPVTPVRLLAWMFSAIPSWLARPLMRRTLSKGRGGKMPSFYIDMQNGSTRSEVDFLNGAVVRFGEHMDVPTPVNRLLNDTLLGIVRGQIPRRQYDHQPERLISEFTKVNTNRGR
jgi:2-dehydropantoate 2-reductase